MSIDWEKPIECDFGEAGVLNTDYHGGEIFVYANSDDKEDYLTIVYSARSVNAVLTSDSGEDYRVLVTMNGESLTDDNKGADVTIGPNGESYILVTEPRLYNIVENPNYLRRQTLRMSSGSADFGLFAFTFGVYQKTG